MKFLASSCMLTSILLLTIAVVLVVSGYRPLAMVEQLQLAGFGFVAVAAVATWKIERRGGRV